MNDHLRVERIDHWLKNLFIVFGHVVVALPLALQVNGEVVHLAVLGLIPAGLPASANYILNENLDSPGPALLHPRPAAPRRTPHDRESLGEISFHQQSRGQR